MKALCKRYAEPGLWLEDAPEPETGADDVLIRVLKTGICGTDLHIYNWDSSARKTVPVPLIVGHEFVGEIVETGANVHDFFPGEIVSGEGHVVCGRCRNCLAGRRHLCANTEGIGVNRQGAFAEYVTIPQTNVWHHAPGMDLDVAALFDPLGNAVHTVLSFDVLGEDVLITGAGPIGCMAAAIARHAGARFVVVTDVKPWRLELAKKMGATHVLDARTESIADMQKELGMKEGFDVGMEMSGSADAFVDMVANMCHGGKIAMPVMLGEARLASAMAEALLEEGVYVIGFSYPVVPEGKARIRVQISAAHTRADLEFALAKFALVKERLGL